VIIHKFGGSSVQDAEHILDVVRIVQAYEIEGEDCPVVVVSAMSGVTDLLISGGRAAAEGDEEAYRRILKALEKRHSSALQKLLEVGGEGEAASKQVGELLQNLARLYESIAVLGELSPRSGDAVSSAGELLSSTLVAAALCDQGTAARAVSAETLLVTDDQHGRANPLHDLTRVKLNQVVIPMLKANIIPVITGFIGATEQGVTTTLGRGGSDFTAAIIGANLDADEVWIWSDVDGILTADPNIVPRARTLDVLTYAEAAELAEYGAEVLHPRTIQPLADAGIPLRILNSFQPDCPGTLIHPQPGTNRRLQTAIISANGMSLVTIGGGRSWGLAEAAEILARLGRERVDVRMFSQSFSDHRLNLVVSSSDTSHCISVVQDVGLDGENRLQFMENAATVSVVSPTHRDVGIVSRAFQALGACGTRVIAVAQASTEFSVSFCIPEEQLFETVRHLHHALGLEG